MPTKRPFGSPTLLRISKMLSNKTNFKLLTKAGLSLLVAATVIAQTDCQSTLQHAETQQTTTANAIHAPVQATSQSNNQNQLSTTSQLAVRPGDLINLKEVRYSEALDATNIFAAGQRIVLTPADPDNPMLRATRPSSGGSGSRF